MPRPIVTTPLALAMLLACAAVCSAERTFYWSMESDTPEVAPEGSDVTPEFYPPQAMRTDKHAHAGDHALDLSGKAWKAATFDNPTDDDVWAPTSQGAIVLWWKYTGAFADSAMLMQITGKAQKTNPKLDTNDGISLRFHGERTLTLGYGWHDGEDYGVARLRYTHTAPFEAGRWYKVTARWNRGGPTTLSLQIDDAKAATSEAKIGEPRAIAWHQLLIGNDRKIAPEGLYIDDFEVWNDFAMTDDEAGANR